MRIHILVEGPSEVAFLGPWLRRFQPGHKHLLYKHQGKGKLPSDFLAVPEPKHRGLLDQLPAKLRALGKSLDPKTDRVLVLVDADQDDCIQLKSRLRDALEASDPQPFGKLRIAVEETEAFFLGDMHAMRTAFGSIRTGELSSYVQDSVCGTWEVFQAVIKARREDKVAWATAMGAHLGTTYSGKEANKSPSFRALCVALRFLAGEPVS